MKPISPFDAEADCELLRKAMYGAGKNKIILNYMLKVNPFPPRPPQTILLVKAEPLGGN